MTIIDWEKQQQRYASRQKNHNQHKHNNGDMQQAPMAGEKRPSQHSNGHRNNQNDVTDANLTEKKMTDGTMKKGKFINLVSNQSRWRERLKGRLKNDKSPKPPKIKKVKNPGIPWVIRAIILLPFVIGLFFFGALASPWNHVQKIDISGNQLVSTEEISKASAVLPSMDIIHLRMVKQELEKNLVNSNSIIKSAAISTENWHDVTINIQEYRPIAYIKEVDFYYLVLENKATVREPVPVKKLAIPELAGFDETRQNDLVNELTKLPDEVLSQIDSIINVDGKNTRIAFRMNDGNIISGLIPTIAERMQYYPSITEQLEGQTGLIDMEVGIYFTELTPANDPFATEEEQQAYRESTSSDRGSETESAEINVSTTSESASQSEAASSQAVQ